jgi:hypothetical protein
MQAATVVVDSSWIRLFFVRVDIIAHGLHIRTASCAIVMLNFAVLSAHAAF